MAPLPGPSGMMVCTEPLPKVRVPIRVARLWSCSAPATISEADADPPLIRTTSGLPLIRSPARAVSHEGAGHRNRLVEQAAGVVAQVDDIAGQLLRRDLVRNLADGFLQPV